MSRFVTSEIGNEELPPIIYWHGPVLPLEKALEPVMSRFNELDRSIALAKNHFSRPSEHGLTLDESVAIYLYTMEAGDHSFYRLMNKDLRNIDRNFAKPWIPFLKLFESAISKLPIVQGVVWRGMKGNLRDEYKKGGELRWWSVTSCSPSIKAAEKFLPPSSHGTLLTIEAKNARDISGYTFYPDEYEYVLKPGTRLFVADDPADLRGSAVVHVKELDDNPTVLNPSVIGRSTKLNDDPEPAKLSSKKKTRAHVITE